MMRSVVIVAGGTGLRMQTEIPKQFIEILGKPIIIWTMERFISFDPKMKIILVIPEKHLFVWQDYLSRYPSMKRVIITTGGASRYLSVQNGLEHVDGAEIVGIHDAVRPLVSKETIARCYAKAAREGSAIPVIAMEDSLRIEEFTGNKVLDRSSVKRVQTPQVFKAHKIKEAYQNSLNDRFTDDASVYESYFKQVKLVEGNPENIKITIPADLKVAKAYLSDH